MSPEDKFFSEGNRIKRLSVEESDKIFLLEIERKVTHDCIVSIDSIEYEVNPKYAGRKVKLRYSPDLSEIYVVEADGLLTPINLLNKSDNAYVKRNKFYLSAGGDF